MIPLVIIRPEPGASATLSSARAMGLNAHAFPLFKVRPLDWEPVPPEEIDALVLGSANALRHGGPALARYRGMPAYAVGEKTAEAGQAVGLEIVAVGKDRLQQVMARLDPRHRRLLRLAGRERVDLSLPQDVTLTVREIYASEPQPFPAGLIEMLRKSAVVLLHSGEAAAHFARGCTEAAVPRGNVRLAAIAPRVAQRAGDGWASVQSAPETNDAALLAMASGMCQYTADDHSQIEPN